MGALEKEFTALELWVFSVCSWLLITIKNKQCLFIWYQGSWPEQCCVWSSVQKLSSRLPSLVRGDLAAGRGKNIIRSGARKILG